MRRFEHIVSFVIFSPTLRIPTDDLSITSPFTNLMALFVNAEMTEDRRTESFLFFSYHIFLSSLKLSYLCEASLVYYYFFQLLWWLLVFRSYIIYIFHPVSVRGFYFFFFFVSVYIQLFLEILFLYFSSVFVFVTKQYIYFIELNHK